MTEKTDAPQAPLCFVLMPFGEKRDPASGVTIEFDRVYDLAVRPAIRAAEMEPIRADEERTGGIIHQAMFERLILCEYAVADLTTANANVFYELGIRHAVRPATTQPIFATPPPFDVALLRALPYQLGPGGQFGEAEAAPLRTALATKLTDLRRLQHEDAACDSPVFSLVEGFRPQELDRSKTDTFRKHARYEVDTKEELARARDAKDLGTLDRIRDGAAMDTIGAGVAVDLLLSYRALGEHQRMVDLHDALPLALRNAVMLREQRAFALNRLGRRDEAQRELEAVIRDHGPSSETNGLLGRVMKDRWLDAREQGDEVAARGHLRRAIDVYVAGYRADMRDAYPGINALTLLSIEGSEKSLSLRSKLQGAVELALDLRLANVEPDYWDHATRLELGVLAEDREASRDALDAAVATRPEAWQLETTAKNLRLIAEAWRERGAEHGWLDEILSALER